MKKVIKWTAYILILGALLVYSVCAFSAPEFTKHATDVIMEWLNTPVAIAGISTTLGGIITYVIVNFVIKNTKFGRKEINNLKTDYNQAKEDISEYKHNINLVLANQEEEFKNYRQSCENQVTMMLEEFEDLQKKTISALKTIPNKKVQAIVEEYEAKYDERKKEIIEKTIYTNDYVDNKLNELREYMEKMLNEAKETINSETEAA